MDALLGNNVDIGLVISKILGYLIIVGSFIVKVPQIVKILKNRSVAGLSAVSLVIELVGFTNTFSYSYLKGFPASTYGENLTIAVQNMIILYLIFSYRKAINGKFFLGVVVYLIYMFSLVSGQVPFSVMEIFQVINIPLFSISKIPQIVSNYKAHNVGQLAFMTIAMTFGGNLARVFTTIKEVPSIVMLTGFSVGLFLNGILFLQVLLYPGAPSLAKQK